MGATGERRLGSRQTAPSPAHRRSTAPRSRTMTGLQSISAIAGCSVGQRRDPEDHVLERSHVLLRRAAEAVEQREGARASAPSPRRRRSVSGATRTATSRVSSTVTPPAPHRDDRAEVRIGASCRRTSPRHRPPSPGRRTRRAARRGRRSRVAPSPPPPAATSVGASPSATASDLGLVHGPTALSATGPCDRARPRRPPRPGSATESWRADRQPVAVEQRADLVGRQPVRSPRSSAARDHGGASSARDPRNLADEPSGFSRHAPCSAACASAIAACSGNAYDGIAHARCGQRRREPAGRHEAGEHRDPAARATPIASTIAGRDRRGVVLERRDVDHDQRVDRGSAATRRDRPRVVLAGGRRDHVDGIRRRPPSAGRNDRSAADRRRPRARAPQPARLARVGALDPEAAGVRDDRDVAALRGSAGSRAAPRRRTSPRACRCGSRRTWRNSASTVRRTPRRARRCATSPPAAPARLRPLFTATIGLRRPTRRATLGEAPRVPERLEVQEHDVRARVLSQ